MRKIAANYICLPGFPLVKNGYVILEQGRVKDVVDTGGRIREIQGLEFYGGLIVAAYVAAYQGRLEEGDLLLPWLDEIYRRGGKEYQGVGIWEGADLLKLTWTNKTKFRLLEMRGRKSVSGLLDPPIHRLKSVRKIIFYLYFISLSPTVRFS